jgi:hypothetical protein
MNIIHSYRGYHIVLLAGSVYPKERYFIEKASPTPGVEPPSTLQLFDSPEDAKREIDRYSRLQEAYWAAEREINREYNVLFWPPAESLRAL